ncbi:MAG: lectin-like protein, partial [candidate division Zixibacteria bacterium]|nr:lectin-like protein [candidate division Zixibacteria bacterium]
MSNRKPAGPATKSKNRQVFRVAIGAALCCSVLLGSATAQVVVNPVNGHSYEYVRVRGYISWGAAKVWASSQDGYLATVTDATEARLVAGLLTAPGQKAFLGASDINDSCDWLWVTGEPFLYTDWAPGEPSGEEPCENSLRTSYELGGKWEADVSPLDGYIVEWDFFHSDTLTDFHQWKVSDGGNGHWYALLPDGMPWVQARDLAGQFNQNGTFGHLATITSEAENLFIADNIVSRIPAPDDRVDPVWLGGYDDSAWVWITGEPFSYTNWGLYEPDSAANAALAMIASSQWGSDYNAWLAESRDSHWRSVIEFDTEPASDTLLNLVQWPVSEGGNGHWYAYLPSTLSWDQARAAAVRFEKDGVAGHLATVTSEAENSFIFE